MMIYISLHVALIDSNVLFCNNGLITIELDFDNPNRNSIRNNEEAVSSIQKSIDFVKDAIK